MFDVIIPLRSKSKGLKNKNILPFAKKVNLANFTIKKIVNIKKIRKVYVLTDSKIYKKKLINHSKIDKNYVRKRKFSTSNSKINNLIEDFLNNYYKNLKNQNFLILQVTSPTLSINEIKKTLNFIERKKINSLMHICKTLESPYEIIEKKNNTKWSFLIKKRILNRQNYKRVFYFITGSLFFFRKNFFKKYKEIYNNKSIPYIVDKINFLDIDDRLTYEIAKKIINIKIRK